MDFQVVVLAGGTCKKLLPLVSKDVPKALLPVANRPVLSYVLEQLELSNLKDLIVVVEGEDAALCVGGWISNAYVDRLHVKVIPVTWTYVNCCLGVYLNADFANV
ncbi:TRANSLATION INITIATION FACTOR EIF-2B SUBUNIT GAMMA [Salix koriyanagi]|uniref:Translation initiation factor eIF2B subunit gamma n=1 Tax=Salix koriyanagi TaxID=2511006 RepID=A0A9Q0TR37_9ROSI|nr:TRANSLATION INITIATION FACTOR EIF-2B SUBUNIT GAMMA [Salix koriyanagi]